MMDIDKALWLKEQGAYFCLDWVNKMEDELLESVVLMVPVSVDYSQDSQNQTYEPIVFTIEDFLEFAPKGKVYTTADGIIFSQ